MDLWLKAGSCLRRCLLENLEDADVVEKAGSGKCCCSCDMEEERIFFYMMFLFFDIVIYFIFTEFL